MGSPERFERFALPRNHSLEPDTRNRDPIRSTVRYSPGNLQRRVSKRVASLADSDSVCLTSFLYAYLSQH